MNNNNKNKQNSIKDIPGLPRSAKGKRPQYFHDPAVDKLHIMLMTTIEELSVARDRIDTLERLIEKKGILKISEIENFEPNTQESLERTSRRIQYIKRVLKGITDEKDQLSKEKPLDFKEVVKVVSS